MKYFVIVFVALFAVQAFAVPMEKDVSAVKPDDKDDSDDIGVVLLEVSDTPLNGNDTDTTTTDSSVESDNDSDSESGKGILDSIKNFFGLLELLRVLLGASSNSTSMANSTTAVNSSDLSDGMTICSMRHIELEFDPKFTDEEKKSDDKPAATSTVSPVGLPSLPAGLPSLPQTSGATIASPAGLPSLPAGLPSLPQTSGATIASPAGLPSLPAGLPSLPQTFGPAPVAGIKDVKPTAIETQIPAPTLASAEIKPPVAIAA